MCPRNKLDLTWLEDALGSLGRNVESFGGWGNGGWGLGGGLYLWKTLIYQLDIKGWMKIRHSALHLQKWQSAKGVEVEGFIFNKLKDFTGFGEYMELNSTYIPKLLFFYWVQCYWVEFWHFGCQLYNLDRWRCLAQGALKCESQR